MENIRTKLIILSLTGAVTGMFICIIFYLLGAYPDELLLNRPAFFLQFIGSGIFGVIVMGGTITYEIESWSLLRATFTHFLLTMISFIVMDRLMGWHYFTGKYALPFAAGFSLIYFVIWLIQYIRWKIGIRKINRDLEVLTHRKGARL